MSAHREIEARMEYIQDYKRDAEALLQVLSGLRSATESVQESPKKDRKHQAPRG